MRRNAQLAEICSVVTDGTHDSPKLQSEGIPFIKGKHISGGTIDFENCDFITPEEHAKAIKRVKPQYGDVLFSNIGSVGDSAQVKTDLEFSIKNVALLRADEGNVTADFLFYLMRSPHVLGSVLSKKSGSAQPFVSLDTLRKHEVEIPDLPTQRKIAAILSAYDDLIENNTRRVRVLEQMARALYREWFVEYRFPGHEQAQWVEDEAGRRPAGWEVSSIGASFVTILGGTPSRNKPEYWGGNVPWLNSGKANDLRVIEPSEYITAEGYKRSAAKMMPPGATIIAITGATLGQVSRLEIHATGNQSLVGLWGFEEYQNSYIYLATKLEWITQIVSKAGGGAQQHVNKDKINETVVILPPSDVLQAFDAKVKPLFDLVRSLLFRNANLRRTRDLLLPRLVSGELDVSGLRVAGVEGEVEGGEG